MSATYATNRPVSVKSSFFFYTWKPYASLGAIHFDGPREEIYRHWIVTRLLITREIRNTDGKSSRRWIFSPIVSRKDSREASSQLFTLTQGPGFTIEIIRCYRTACHSATVSRVPFAASSAPQIAVPETPPANQSRIMVIHRYSIVVFLAKTRRLGDDPTFLPALPAFVTKPLNVWIMVRAPMKRFMIEHRLEVSSMEQENLCNSGNENRE